MDSGRGRLVKVMLIGYNSYKVKVGVEFSL